MKEIAEENNKMNFGGPMELVSKNIMKEFGYDGEADKNEEGFLMNSDDEVIAYYSNNRFKKFYKKPINGNFDNSSMKKSLSNYGVS